MITILVMVYALSSGKPVMKPIQIDPMEIAACFQVDKDTALQRNLHSLIALHHTYKGQAQFLSEEPCSSIMDRANKLKWSNP